MWLGPAKVLGWLVVADRLTMRTWSGTNIRVDASLIAWGKSIPLLISMLSRPMLRVCLCYRSYLLVRQKTSRLHVMTWLWRKFGGRVSLLTGWNEVLLGKTACRGDKRLVNTFVTGDNYLSVLISLIRYK